METTNSNQYFGPVKEKFQFEVKIPSDYNHDTWIDFFVEMIRKQKPGIFCREWDEILRRLYGKYKIGDDVRGYNFKKATTRLVPNKTYKIKLFPINHCNLKDGLGFDYPDPEIKITGDDCLKFLKEQNAILTGMHGLTLAYYLLGQKLHTTNYLISLDEKEASLMRDWRGKNYHGISIMYVWNGIDLDTCGFRVNFNTMTSGNDLLCFYEME